jgi:hypothetical protein
VVLLYPVAVPQGGEIALPNADYAVEGAQRALPAPSDDAWPYDDDEGEG